MRRSTLTYFAGLATITLAVILRIVGIIGFAGFWFALWGIAQLQVVTMLRELREAEARMAGMAQVFASMAVRAVRCAGCHRAAVLAQGGPSPDDGDFIALPPGWDMRNDRPYCATCLAKAN